ncbi:MAG: type II toxin-antitoxin system PemK/MazF family toxin [Erysipelotrichaceae bacterium]|nr:type II toxin-antitoxin system PemK/MazF family toxin [Erysipelotrichaceae bacterium]
MKFKSDYKAIENYHKVTKNIEKKLLNVDSEIAMEFVEWFDKKATYLKQSLQKSSYLPQPDDLKKGDIVWVEFGINVGTELSDRNKKGHYAIVWAIDLGNIIVIPLSSKPILASKLSLDLGVIDELNADFSSSHSYLKVDAIRSVCKRRISRMNKQSSGKISLPQEKIEQISQFLKDNFI